MNYNHPNRNNSTFTVRVMCAIVFVLFSFCWLFFFQPDMMMMTQHVLSNGQTHYNRIAGAVIITLTLYLLQLGVFGIIRLKMQSHALTYVPSMLLLAMLSSATPSDVNSITYVSSWWIPVVIFLVWLVIVFIARLAQEVEDNTRVGLLSRPMWINMLVLSLMMICVAWIGNTNAVSHYRLKAERCLLDGDLNGALKSGRKSLESDVDLTMIRMYALARKGELGERLFEYPIIGTSEMMLPTDSLSTLMLYPVDSLYRFIGARPAGKMTPMRYLELVQKKDSLPNKVVNDYLLCGYLIDRQIDRFASEVGKYYTINDSLPKHYREALTLYTHLRAHPVIVYHQAVMDEDYNNLQTLEKQYPQLKERMIKVKEQYQGTYWYYYKYEKPY